MGKGINHNLPKNKNLERRARELRRSGVLSETLLWQQINRGKISGLDFDRQVIIGTYIVDFYCAEKKLIIEIDGYSHNLKGDYDEKRTAYLEGLGLRVIRIADADIKNNIAGVIGFLHGLS